MDDIVSKQDRFTTCFKNLWNNPFCGFRIAEGKPDKHNVLKTSGTFGAAKPVAKPIPKPVKVSDMNSLVNSLITNLFMTVS